MISLCGYERRKEPEKVRAALIDAAARMIEEKGLGRLTIDAVARSADVTKGGLFHHFATKDDLIQGVQDAMIQFAGEAVDAEMAKDPEPHGRFTRAYLNCLFQEHRLNGTTSSRTLCLAMLADPDLQIRWSEWFASKLARHADTDDNPGCALVRLATDGMWLNSLKNETCPPPPPPELYERLIGLTRPNG